MAIDWETVENGIHEWFEESTGICTMWRNQASPQPDYPFAGLLIISGPTQVGIDETRTSEVVGAPAGEECLITTCGLREITVSCQIYSCENSNPEAHARAFMTLAYDAVYQAKFLKIFEDAGLAVIDRGVPINIDEVVENRFISRQNMDMRFGLTAVAEEKTGFIDKMDLTETYSDGVTDFSENSIVEFNP